MAELHVQNVDSLLLDQIWHEARLRDISVDQVIVEALTEHFGTGDGLVAFDESRLGNFDDSEEQAMAAAIDALEHMDIAHATG